MVWTAITFNYKQVTFSDEKLFQFSLSDTDIFNVAQPQLIGIDICNAQVRQLQRVVVAFLIFGEATNDLPYVAKRRLLPAGFGFYEAAFDSGFEDGSFVAFEIGFDALEVGDGSVEAGELRFDFSDDRYLRLGTRHSNRVIAQVCKAYVFDR